MERIAAILESGEVSPKDRGYVFDNYIPSAMGAKRASQYFTPYKLALEAAYHATGGIKTVLDLCAGIGMLSYAIMIAENYGAVQLGSIQRIVAIERDAELVAVGKKLLPMIDWYCGDIFDADFIKHVYAHNGGRFDVCVTNPPYGIKSRYDWLNYKGRSHLAAVEVAARVSDAVIAILPGMDVPNMAKANVSIDRRYEDDRGEIVKFMQANPSLLFEATCVDCTVYRNEWVGASPDVELVSISGSNGDAIEMSLFDRVGQLSLL